MAILAINCATNIDANDRSASYAGGAVASSLETRRGTRPVAACKHQAMCLSPSCRLMRLHFVSKKTLLQCSRWTQ